MKRYFALGICAVLLLLTGLALRTEEVTVGKGKGESAKISSIEDFFDLADSFSEQGKFGRSKSVSLAAASSDRDEEEDKSESKFKNLTFSEISSVTNDGEFGGIALQRELTGYMTEEAVYYHSEGVLSVTLESGSQTQENASQSLLFNIDIYLDSENCYLRFHEFLAVDNAKTLMIPDEWKDVWISCVGEDGEDLLSIAEVINVNNYNVSVMSYIGDLFEKYSDGSLKEDKKRFISKDLGIKDGTLELNLESAQNPRLSLLAPGISDVINFSNINNTVVKLPKDFKAYDAEGLKDFLEEGGF